MRRSTIVGRILGGVILTAAVLTACADNPQAPADDAALNQASTSAIVTNFTATDVLTGMVNPGRAEVRGPQLVIRGVAVTSRLTGTDPRASGNTIITFNEELSLADGSGPVWGKFEVAADVGGTWVGTFSGQRAMAGPGQWVATLRLEGRGIGGAIDGLRFTAQELVYQDQPFGGPFFGQVTGRMVQSH